VRNKVRYVQSRYGEGVSSVRLQCQPKKSQTDRPTDRQIGYLSLKKQPKLGMRIHTVVSNTGLRKRRLSVVGRQ